MSFDLQNDPNRDFLNASIPNSASPSNIIAPFWADLDTSQTGTIFYLLSGIAPNRVFTVEWHQTPYVADFDIIANKPIDTSGNITLEASLYESTGTIIFRYKDVSFDDSQFTQADQGLSATIGIENENGQRGLQYSFNSPSLKDQLTIRYSIPENTLTAEAGSDSLVPTGSLVILDGSRSSDSGVSALSYEWSLIDKPVGSAAAIADSKTAVTSFLADSDGIYIARLLVDNGEEQSSPDTITIRALGNNTKIQILTNKSLYKSGDLLELYLWLGNGVSEPITEVDAFIGFILPDGSPLFLDGNGNWKEGDSSNSRTFTPIAQKTSLPTVWVFPEQANMNVDSDGNGKADTYLLYAAQLPKLPPGEYFAFATLAQHGTAQAGSPVLIGNTSLTSFSLE
jgi:hypothetical protein